MRPTKHMYPQAIPAISLAISSVLAADLPVSQVVLYKNGVGYFERAGELKAGEAARLDFKAAEMNDVLKSLSVTQKGGGPVTGLRYDSSEPLNTKLGEFPFRVENGQSLSAFLDQLKGAVVSLKLLSGETDGGTIVSGRRLPSDAQRNERELLILMLASGDLKTFDLGVVQTLKLADPLLEAELRRFLSTLTASRSKEKKSVYLDSTDDKARQVALSYMIPTPIWKSSYRLIFGAAGDPTLEGWAIVDNTTGEDWNKVQLALVSGRPVSFISRLYEPKYVARQTADLAEEQAQGPVTYDGAVAELRPMLAAAPPAQARRMGGNSQFQANAMMDKAQVQGGVVGGIVAGVPSTLAVSTEGRDLGDLFEYRFSTPVTVRKNESVMLPFVQQKVTARKLLIYTSGQSSRNPMSAAAIVNSTGKTLDGGPITVFDAAAYGGEALMESLKAGDKRLISYATDLGTRITTNAESGSEVVREVKAKDGILTSKLSVQETTTYTIRNVDPRAKTLIIEHPLKPESKLLGDVKPMETSANHHRFEVKLAANANEKFVVREEHLLENTEQISNLNDDQILIYLRNKSLSEAARKQLDAVRAKKSEIQESTLQANRLSTEINELVQDQERVRQNLNSLNRVNGQEAQVRKYASDLAASEAKLATLRDNQSANRKRVATLQGELSDLVNKLAF
ncbi:MAG: hypothetical protein K2X03_12455 [Bryobacteraceae bacterium]|nr:hypothetical protein [Bryobacteraceae bacterium]